MSFRKSTKDIHVTTANSIHFTNDTGSTFEATKQPDGRVVFELLSHGKRVTLRLNKYEVAHLRDLLT